MALTTLEREYFMTGIAAYMAAKRLPNQISNIQLNEVITDLVNAIPESVSFGSPAISGETTQPLRTRLKDAEFGIEHVKTDVRACGLLVDDPAAPGTFRFGHKSFMEYLFAAVVAEGIQNPRSEKSRTVLKATNAQIEDILSFPVGVEFLTELLVGIKDGNEAEHTPKEFTTANRLFRTILGKSGVYQRPAVFNVILTHCIARRLHVARFGRLFSEAFPSFLMTMFVMSVVEWIFTGSGSNSLFRDNLGVSFLRLPVLATVVSMMAILSMPTRTLRRKLHLWNRICTELGIQDKTLHEVVGTSLTPWVREQSFEYSSFLEDASDSKSEPQAKNAS